VDEMNELEAAIEETQSGICDIHGEYEAKIFTVMDKRIKQKCPKCVKIKEQEDRESAELQRKEDERRKIIKLFGVAAIPPRFKDKSFSDYKADCEKSKKALIICEKYAEHFDKRLEAGGGLVLCGSPGTGKTHLAASIANHVIKHFGRSVIFNSVMAAMRKVKSTYSKTSEMTETEAVESFTRPDLLILDEVGVQFGSDAEKMILFEIINIRYQNMKPTILISNLPHNELNDYIGERVVDRMREGGGAIIPFDWDSYRSKL
jgi:DNA replication protein DnaC